MGFSGYDDLIDKISNLDQKFNRMFFKRGVTAQGNGVWQRTWSLIGIPGAGAEPAAGSGTLGAGGSVYSNTAGSINVANVASPMTKHLIVWGAFSSEQSPTAVNLVGRVQWALQDRLVGVGGIGIGSTGAKDCNTQTLPRYGNGEGCDVWIEMTTGATGTPVIQLTNYTNQAGTPNRSGAAVTLATNPIAGSIYQLPLQDGDTGIQSIQQINVNTLGTSGVVNVIITKQLGPVNLGTPYAFNLRSMIPQVEALPQIFDGASLEVRFQAAGTTAFDINGTAIIAYG